MRNILAKIPQTTCSVFVGTLHDLSYNRLVITNIEVYDKGGQKIIGKIDHCLTALRPFKLFNKGDKVRFTGKPKKYYRADGSMDYQIIVNKVKKIEKKC